MSRIGKDLDEAVQAFRDRPLKGNYPYLWLDATYLKVRENHRVVSMAEVVAIGVRETGEREILGFAVGPSEEASFWLEFMRSLLRGNRGAGRQSAAVAICCVWRVCMVRRAVGPRPAAPALLGKPAGVRVSAFL